MCYCVKFGSSASKGVRINSREPPKLGSVWAPLPGGRGVDGPIEYTPPHMCYPAEFGRSMSNGTSVFKEIRLKNLNLVSSLSSSSLKVIGTDTRHGSVSPCRYFKSVSVSVYRSVFFQVGTVFVVGISKYRDIGSVFWVFHFASKGVNLAHCQSLDVSILKICFRVNPQILTEDPCQRSRRSYPMSAQAPT